MVGELDNLDNRFTNHSPTIHRLYIYIYQDGAPQL